MVLERHDIKSVKMKWNGRFACLVVQQGGVTRSHATYIIQGYGVSNARLHVTKLQDGLGTSFAISSTEQAVTFADEGGASFSIFMLMGTLPIIS